MGLEIGFQIQDLPLLRLHKGQKKCLFVGAGDSFAACLAAQFASGNSSLSCYPLDVVDNPSIADGRAIYIVSVSGKTRANILAARAAKLRGFRTVAVTAEPDSPLAHSCDASIKLRFRRAQVTTAGTISFSASLVTCLSIAAQIALPQKLSNLLVSAERQVVEFVDQMPLGIESYYFLGNGILYPIAMYGSMKLNEVIGAKAVPYRTEEFFHSPVFGASKKDLVLILGQKNEDGMKMSERLAAEGVNAIFIKVPSGGLAETLLYSTFFVQMMALKIALKLNLKECHYLQDKKVLAISSDFIY